MRLSLKEYDPRKMVGGENTPHNIYWISLNYSFTAYRREDGVWTGNGADEDEELGPHFTARIKNPATKGGGTLAVFDNYAEAREYALELVEEHIDGRTEPNPDGWNTVEIENHGGEYGTYGWSAYRESGKSAWNNGPCWRFKIDNQLPDTGDEDLVRIWASIWS